MSNKNIIFIACVGLIYISSAHSMFCVKRPVIQKYATRKKSIKDTNYPSILAELDRIKLKACVQACHPEAICTNSLCCRPDMSCVDNDSIQNDKREHFLRYLDEKEGRINFVKRLQRKYNRLNRLKDTIKKVLSDEPGKKNNKELSHKISVIEHQLNCLRAQLKTIYNDTPEIALLNSFSVTKCSAKECSKVRFGEVYVLLAYSIMFLLASIPCTFFARSAIFAVMLPVPQPTSKTV